MSKLVTCAFCRGKGNKPGYNTPCPACGGSGQMAIMYDNPVKCSYCKGKGNKPGYNTPCPACQGAGVIAPGIQIL